jgi:hypothetical protein
LQLQAAIDPERELRFRVPASVERRMDAVQSAANEESPTALLRPGWDADRWQQWRVSFQQSLQHVSDGLAAAHYHHTQVVRIERRVTELVMDNRDLFADMPGLERGFTFGPRCRPLAFEFQAFLFAERRTLEYLAVAIARFSRDCHRIKGLGKALVGQEPRGPRERVEARLDRDLPTFGLSSSSRRDARDRVAHWEAVDAGQINILVLASGEIRIAIFGGEEGLKSLNVANDPGLTLGEAVNERLARLAEFAFGCFTDLGLAEETSLG